MCGGHWTRKHHGAWRQDRGFAASGNRAFDDYVATKLDELAEKRRRLAAEEQAFARFVDELRKAKDQEEFRRFLASKDVTPGQGAAV